MAPPPPIWADLRFLLNGSSKKLVDDVFIQCFRHRQEPVFPASLGAKIGGAFGIESADEWGAMVEAVTALIQTAVYHRYDPEELLASFPSGFHANLQQLLTAIIVAHLDDWVAATQQETLSLPRLIDFDYRVDIKAATESTSGQSVPCVLCEMKVEEEQTSSVTLAGVRTVHFELGKETLETMLDSLEKISEQMNALAS